MLNFAATAPLARFQASLLATPIAEAVCIDVESKPHDAALLLSSQSFEQAPVISNGETVGWVRTEALVIADSVEVVYRRLPESRIVSTVTGIKSVFRELSVQPFVFLVGDSGIESFVTPSDLDRHASRSYFYLLVAAIGMRLSDLIRLHVDRAAAVQLLEDNKRWKRALNQDIDTHPVEYLYLR